MTQQEPQWSNWRKANYAFFDEILAPLHKEMRLLDLGAGPLQFKELFLPFVYTGVDFEQFEHVTLVTDLTKTIPLPDASADIITLSNTLEHIPNTEHFLRECRRLLATDGLLVGTIPFLVAEHQEPYDFNRYTHFQLELLLKNAGFTHVMVRPLGQQIDIYNSVELKVFDQLRLQSPGVLLEGVRLWRRGEMRLLRWLFGNTAASNKITEGYGFTARP